MVETTKEEKKEVAKKANVKGKKHIYMNDLHEPIYVKLWIVTMAYKGYAVSRYVIWGMSWIVWEDYVGDLFEKMNIP